MDINALEKAKRAAVAAGDNDAVQDFDDQIKSHPSFGMSGTDKFLVGAGSSIDKAYRGLKGLVGGDTKAGDEAAATYKANRPAGWQTTAGEIAGDVAAQAPVALIPGGLPAQMAAAAAGAGAMTPGSLGERATSATIAAGGAGAGHMLSKALGRIAKPIGDKAADVVALEAKGIKPTFGMGMGAKGGTVGKTIEKMEEATQHIPLVSGPLRATREAAMDQWQSATRKAALPDALRSAAVETVDDVGKVLGKGYDDILKALPVPHASVRYQPNIGKITTGQALEKGQREMIKDTFKSIQMAHLGTKDATAAGAQQVESALKSKAANFLSSADPGQREIGHAFNKLAKDFGGTWRGGLGKAEREAVKAIDKAYPNYSAIRQAAKSVGTVASDAVPSNYTPGVLARAARTVDRSPMKGKYVAGEAPQQELARLGLHLAEKGKFDGAGEIMTALAGGGAAVLGGLSSIPTAAGIWGYGTKPMQDFLMGRAAPAAQEAILQALRRTAGYAGAAGAGASQQME